MTLQLTLRTCLTLFAFTLIVSAFSQSSDSLTFAHFDLDDCAANFGKDEHTDYSEFTAVVDNAGACADFEIVSGYLYNPDPEANPHSCTPGVDGSIAMCISSQKDCSFNPNSDLALKFDVRVTPGSDGIAILSGLEFYEQAPTTYTWLNSSSGPDITGPNNYPTYYKLRILKNGEEIYVSPATATERVWNLETFDFSTNPAFVVTSPTMFRIELFPFCAVGNEAIVSAWDIDELRLSTDCCLILDGGELEGGPFEFCVGDGEPDFVSGVTLSGNIGKSQYVVTDEEGTILGLPPAPDSVNFDEAGGGTCLIWHVSYFGALGGLEIGNNAMTDLIGDCHVFSNPITVVRNQLPEAGELSGGPFEFCVGDGIPDHVDGVAISGNTGSGAQYVITDDENTILMLPDAPEDVDFDGAGGGVCLIWHVSYEGTFTGLEMGNNLMTDLEGCFSISNSVTVTRNELPEAGELSGGPFEFCVGDGEADHVDGVTLTGNTGSGSQYVVTDTALNILGLPGAPEDVNFDEAGPGICLIWHVAYEGDITGIEIGNNVEDVMGCFSISNSVRVTRFQPEGGTLSGGPFTFCVGDGVADRVEGVELSGSAGSGSQYVVTDTAYNILGLPDAPGDVNFDEAGPGICLIWHVAYDGDLTGVEIGNNVLEDVTGCFSLSNSVMVTRNQPEGGELTGGPFEFCIDSIPDFVDSVELTGNVGESQWVVTDTVGMILGLPPAPDSVDFNEAGPGVCLIWHLSYIDSLGGAEVGNSTDDLTGCFSLSNAITVTRLEAPCTDSLSSGGGPVLDMRAYPNPARDMVTLDLVNGGIEPLTIHVIDVYGRVCMQEKCFPMGDRRLDMSNLPEGQYFIRVVGVNGRVTKSVMLLR